MGRRRAFVRSIKRASRRGVPFTRLVGSTVGMGLALAATSAWAQTPPAESPTKSSDSQDDVSLPGVDVRGQRNQYKIEEPSLYKLPDPIKDTPQSITVLPERVLEERADRKSTRLNSSHLVISYAVFCLKKKKQTKNNIICKQNKTTQ